MTIKKKKHDFIKINYYPNWLFNQIHQKLKDKRLSKLSKVIEHRDIQSQKRQFV